MEIINLTPHDVIVRREAGEVIFPASGEVARVRTGQVQVRTLEHNGIEIPVMETTFEEVIGLPKADETRLYIVSSLVRTAPSMAGRSDLISPDTSPLGAIRDDKGQIIAVRGFQK